MAKTSQVASHADPIGRGPHLAKKSQVSRSQDTSAAVVTRRRDVESSSLPTPPACPTDRSPALIADPGFRGVRACRACSERRRPIGQAFGRGRETRRQPKVLRSAKGTILLRNERRSGARIGASRNSATSIEKPADLKWRPRVFAPKGQPQISPGHRPGNFATQSSER
jgi:hypothetical protein